VLDADCIAFLQWALPQLHLHWPGFRKVRRQVCRRIDKRRAELGLADIAAYRSLLETTRDEWRVLDSLCRVTISRFARDRGVWVDLVASVLPRLADEARRAGRSSVRAWSAGCGAGEEPYTLAIAWELGVTAHAPDVALDVLATDTDDVQLARAARAVFPSGTLRELSDEWRRAAFEPEDEPENGGVRLRDRFRTPVRFLHHDVRTAAPGGPFDLVLCRNLAFTYFDEAQQRQVAESLRAALRVGGVLVVGIHEHVPAGMAGLLASSRCMYRRA
jgi:chemotaxis protein methyltransferase CheR